MLFTKTTKRHSRHTAAKCSRNQNKWNSSPQKCGHIGPQTNKRQGRCNDLRHETKRRTSPLICGPFGPQTTQRPQTTQLRSNDLRNQTKRSTSPLICEPVGPQTIKRQDRCTAVQTNRNQEKRNNAPLNCHKDPIQEGDEAATVRSKGNAGEKTNWFLASRFSHLFLNCISEFLLPVIYLFVSW